MTFPTEQDLNSKLLSHVWLFATPMDCSPWNSPGQNTGVCSFSLLQGIFPAQGSNPGLLYCRGILYQLSHKENLRKIWIGWNNKSPDKRNSLGSFLKAVYCHPVYIAFIQNATCEMPCWMDHKLESSLPGKTSTNIHIIRRAADISLIAEGKAQLKNLLMRVKDKSEKAGLKLDISKN